MNGKDMLKGIQNLDADLIEEAEFGTYPKKNTRPFGKRKLMLLMAAVLIIGTMTAATVYTRWSATMQMGSLSGLQPSEQIKKQAEKTGLSVTPTETEDSRQTPVSATDNGVTVTVVQTLADEYAGKIIFRIEGLSMEKGQLPWVWYDFLIDGQPSYETEYGIGLSGSFFDGITQDAQGNPVYIKNGQPVAKDKNGAWIPDFELNGGIEYCVDMAYFENSLLGKKVTFRFTGFGVQGESKYDEEIMTVPGKWELTWTMEGSSEKPKRWTPNAKIGDLPLTLSEVEIAQYNMKLTYQMDAQAYAEYADFDDFLYKNAWAPHPASLRLKNGTEMFVNGMGVESWDADRHQLTVVTGALDTVLDPEQIVGISFFPGSVQGVWEDRPNIYIPLE